MTTVSPSRTITQSAALAYYYDGIAQALKTLPAGGPGEAFHAGLELPELDEPMRRFLAPSDLRFVELPQYAGRRLILLDLMGNPRTRTTKTFASLIMVARAVHHIRRSGRRIMILTPTSANKGTALRDAVLRAYECGLATADDLRIVTVVPEVSAGKFWRCGLDDEPEWAAGNPVARYRGPDPAGVKEIARRVAEEYGPLLARDGTDLWYTLSIDNYKVADAVRAFFEIEYLPPRDGVARMHAHAVSSAFGLLGHHFGRTLLATPHEPARYFLVQHLGAPDMVLSLGHGQVRAEDRPAYTREATGRYVQRRDQGFPTETIDPFENLDATFYTHRPPTSTEMNAIIARQGGGGIVVSRYECLQRYAQIRSLLEAADVVLPVRPDDLREWSLVMAFTGVLNGIDRGLCTAPEMVIHGSGSYSTSDFVPLPATATRRVETARDLAGVVTDAVFAAVHAAPA
jgi:hypothetical protein